MGVLEFVFLPSYNQFVRSGLKIAMGKGIHCATCQKFQPLLLMVLNWCLWDVHMNTISVGNVNRNTMLDFCSVTYYICNIHMYMKPSGKFSFLWFFSPFCIGHSWAQHYMFWTCGLLKI